MNTARSVIERTGHRLLRHRQLNILGFFLPLAVATAVAGYFILQILSLPVVFALLPPLLCCGFFLFSFWRARKGTEVETIARLLDEKTAGKERFLTIATCTAHNGAASPLLLLVELQAEKQSRTFILERDFPFILDKRVPLSVFAAAVTILLLYFFPTFSGQPGAVPNPSPEAVLAELAKTAQALKDFGTTPQEQMTGAQLLALIQELKDPSLPPQEKQRLIEEAQKRMNLTLPQLLPFDLKLFASKSKNNKGEGNESDQPQDEGNSLAKVNQNLEQLKKSLSAAAGNEPQPGPPQDGEKKEQPQPREAGGGIKFNAPQPQSGEKKDTNGQDSSGQQKSAREQQPNSQAPGQDPNRPGNQQNEAQEQEKKGQSSGPQEPGRDEAGKRPSVGQGKGERFLKSGEQPGGFLTKDARFVKVRVPVGQEAQEGETSRTENSTPAMAKTPYSNAPLKEGPPDQAQPKQPIPLEYRAILQQK